MSNHGKEWQEWGCIHTSLKRGGFRQLKTACNRLHIRRFNACKSDARDNLVSSLICNRRCCFFFKTIIHEIAFSCTRESAVFFLITKARLRLYVNRCHISAETHKFKSTVQKSSGPFPKVSARVPKLWSAVKNQERRALYCWLLCQNLGVSNCYIWTQLACKSFNSAGWLYFQSSCMPRTSR